MSEPALHYEPIALSADSTVVAEYLPDPSKESGYQSEADLEASLIRMLVEQGYQYLPLHTEADLIANLRNQLEALNAITFTDGEWQRFFAEKIASGNDGIVEKTTRIQTDHVQVLRRDDGSFKNIYLLDKQHIHNNRLQVINQYEVAAAATSAGAANTGAARSNRYDVTVLVNGLPIVHIELKRRQPT